MKRIAWLAVCAALASCAPDPDRPLYEREADLAWWKCIFELDKIEAIRGRNLDDLDKGLTSARNQFMMDCMTANNAAIKFEHLSEMSTYLAAKEKRKPSDMTLNSGDRKLPEDPAKQVNPKQ